MYFFFSIFFQLNCIIRNTKKEKRPQFIYFHLHVMIRILKNAACLWKWEIIQRELDELNNQSQHPLSSLFVLVVHAVLAKSSVLYAMGIFFNVCYYMFEFSKLFYFENVGPSNYQIVSWFLTSESLPTSDLFPDSNRRVVLIEGCFNWWDKQSTNQSFIGGTINADVMFFWQQENCHISGDKHGWDGFSCAGWCWWTNRITTLKSGTV